MMDYKDELKLQANGLHSLLSNYKNNENQSLDKLIRAGKEVENQINSKLLEATTKLNNAKYPHSSGHSTEFRAIGESQKNRAYNLLGKNIGLIKSELKKAMDARDYDFFFTLSEAELSSDRKDLEKLQLSEIYNEAMNKTGAQSAQETLKQASILKSQAEAITGGYGSYGTPHGITEDDLKKEFVDKCEKVRHTSEIGYTKDLGLNNRPEFEKFTE